MATMTDAVNVTLTNVDNEDTRRAFGDSNLNTDTSQASTPVVTHPTINL
jgi:hypothetical protein